MGGGSNESSFAGLSAFRRGLRAKTWADVERLANADLAAIASAETPRRCTAFGEELLEPWTRSFQRGSHRQQRRRRRPDAMKARVDHAGLAIGTGRERAHRANPLNLGDEARIETISLTRRRMLLASVGALST
jgi:hypothetical protein